MESRGIFTGGEHDSWAVGLFADAGADDGFKEEFVLVKTEIFGSFNDISAEFCV